MAADVVKSTQPLICSANYQQGFADETGGEIVAWVGDLIGMSDPTSRCD